MYHLKPSGIAVISRCCLLALSENQASLQNTHSYFNVYANCFPTCRGPSMELVVYMKKSRR